MQHFASRRFLLPLAIATALLVPGLAQAPNPLGVEWAGITERLELAMLAADAFAASDKSWFESGQTGYLPRFFYPPMRRVVHRQLSYLPGGNRGLGRAVQNQSIRSHGNHPIEQQCPDVMG